MRKYLSHALKIILLCVFFIALIKVKTKAVDAPGIKFRSISFDEALKESKTEHKPIFVHGYADWCHYCKYMHDSVYPDKEVGDVYNSKFICIMIDMEKEGKEMNKVLNAHSFPVFLFYDTNGEMMHRAAGRRYKQPFLELAKEALDTNRQMRTYKRKYDTGTATPAEVQFYFRMQEVAGMDAQLMIDSYLMKQPDSAFTNANNWRIMYDILKDPTLPIMKRIIGNKKALEATHTADSINNKLINIFNSYLMSYVQQLDSNGYEAAKQKVLHTNGLDIAEKIAAFADLNKHKMKSEWDIYKVEGKKFLEQYAAGDFRRINEVVGNFYDHFGGDKELMALSETWIKKSVGIADFYKGNHLLASVYAMLGKKELALSAASHAIELAKRDNNDYNQTSRLIEYIQRLP
jgi:thioredoxin-related protein